MFLKRCFNSQRDGILRNFFKNKTEQSQRFQFPMGWNSTQSRSLFYSYGKVSIPNGMEFYIEGENMTNEEFMFQFPTGWNSTLYAHQHPLKTRCFNSQRDGILRWPRLVAQKRTIVSIPNGMEFYSFYPRY